MVLERFRYIWYIFLLFLLIFGFQIGNVNTRYIVFILSLLTLSLEKGGFRKLNLTLKNKYNFSLIVLLLLYYCLSILIPTLHNTLDLSLLFESSGIMVILVSVLIYSSVSENYIHTEKQLLNSLFLIFSIQSFIIFFCFLSPTFYEIIRHFQYEQIANVADSYLNSGIARGLALAGDQFFGLSAAYGLIFIFIGRYAAYYNNYKIYLLFLLLIVANFFVGRTGFIGIIFAFFILVLAKVGYSKLLRIIQNVFVCCLIAYIAYFTLVSAETKEAIENNVLPFAFELFYNMNKGNGFSSASSDHLLQMLSIPIEPITYFIGTGKFTNSDGSYYMHTDSGYMRQLLFGGLGYVIVSIILFISVFFNSESVQKKFRTNWNFRVFTGGVIVYFLLLQIKGLTLFFSRETMVVLFYYLVMMNKIKCPNYLESE